MLERDETGSRSLRRPARRESAVRRGSTAFDRCGQAERVPRHRRAPTIPCPHLRAARDRWLRPNVYQCGLDPRVGAHNELDRSPPAERAQTGRRTAPARHRLGTVCVLLSCRSRGPLRVPMTSGRGSTTPPSALPRPRSRGRSPRSTTGAFALRTAEHFDTVDFHNIHVHHLTASFPVDHLEHRGVPHVNTRPHPFHVAV